MTSTNLARPLPKLTLLVALTLLGTGCATLQDSANGRSVAVSRPAAYSVCTASRLPPRRADLGCRGGPSLPPGLGLTAGGSTQRLH